MDVHQDCLKQADCMLHDNGQHRFSWPLVLVSRLIFRIYNVPDIIKIFFGCKSCSDKTKEWVKYFFSSTSFFSLLVCSVLSQFVACVAGAKRGGGEGEGEKKGTESGSTETSTTFHSENPCKHCEISNVYGTLIMKWPKCFWHDLSNMRSPDPWGEKLHQRGLSSVSRLWSNYTQREDVKTSFYSPSKEENQEED